MTATVIDLGYARRMGVNVIEGRTYFLVTDVFASTDLEEPSTIGLPVPGTFYGSSIVRYVTLVKLLDSAPPMKAIYEVETDIKFTYPMVRRTTKYITEIDSLVVPQCNLVSRSSGPSMWVPLDPYPTQPRVKRIRIVEKATQTTYSEATIQNFDDANAGKLYLFNSVYYIYLGTEAIIEPTNQVTVSIKFTTNAKVKSYIGGTRVGWDVSMPALNNLEIYAIKYGTTSATPPIITAVPITDMYDIGATIPWL